MRDADDAAGCLSFEEDEWTDRELCVLQASGALVGSCLALLHGTQRCALHQPQPYCPC